MKLTILYDNTAKVGVAGWGFSALVGDTLFDLGADAVTLRKNAETLGINFSRIKNVVISHEHSDHYGGLDFDVIPELKGKKFFIADFFSNGLKRYIDENADLNLFEDKAVIGDAVAVRLKKEVFLLAHGDNGNAMVTGCSHPGIVNMVKAAKGKRSVDLLAGGFHLAWSPSSRVDEIAMELKALGVKRICPAHCSGENAQPIFKDVFGEGYITPGVGTVIEF